jgi:hypothetical protein
VDECKPLIDGVDSWQKHAAMADLGRTVQVDPIKTRVESVPGQRLKLKCDDVLSNVAFNFNLRCYTWVTWCGGATR